MRENLALKPQNSILSKLLLALIFSGVLFLVLVAALLIGYEAVYANRIFPGVYVHNVDLSGMTLDEAGRHLINALPYTFEGRVTFTYDGQVWEAHPIDLGYLVDPTYSARQAYDTGREGWLPEKLVEKGQAWFRGVHLSPVAYYDERVAQSFLQSIAKEIDQPVREASLGLEGSEVIVIAGQVGRELDIEMTLKLIDSVLGLMQSAEIPLPVIESSPEIIDVGQQADMAKNILSEPLVLTDPEDEGTSWTISPEDLGAMLTIERVKGEGGAGSEYQISINEDLFGVYLNSLAPGLSVYPVNARFIFNDDTRLLEVIEPAIIGRKLDVQSSLAHIEKKLLSGDHQIALKFETIDPAVTDNMTGEELGITEAVQTYTSYFYGSDPARVQNIRAAAAQFHGLLIAPGETFSMANALGNISLENGYAEAPIIYGGQTIQGVGGGVCQVSTTLFRTAFFAGFPIVERHAHSYRVGYYEQERDGSRNSNLAGLDATVYVPIVDMKFINDTDHWLLMETYMGDYFSLTWKFYSTKDGRTVDWNTTGPTNVIPAPDDLWRENPDLAKGEIKKVDYSADGADVSVTRTVYKGDTVYFSDSFFTRFQPWQAIYEYGPGTEIPESASD